MPPWIIWDFLFLLHTTPHARRHDFIESITKPSTPPNSVTARMGKMLGFGFAIAITITTQLFSLATAEPSISYPLNSQLPPVARVDEAFSYSFSPYTFRSDAGNITYTLGEHPSWISIDSEERRLFGIPEQKDVPSGEVVGQTVEIIATDDTGSTTMNSTLVVTRRKAPVVKKPLASQIEGFGPYSAPSSILSYPSTKFSYKFAADTFENENGASYYATSGDSSPLPSWIKFDESTLTFSGTTPSFESLVQPPQNFTFQLVASDIVGFAGEALKFSIVVGIQKITTDEPILELNVTRGDELQYSGLRKSVKVDGKTANPKDLDVEIEGMPKWLSFDKQTWEIKGKPGKDDKSTNMTLSFSDPIADTLDVLVVVNVATGLFKSTFEDMDVKPGEEVELNLDNYLQDPDAVDIEVETQPKQDWLKVKGTSISGLVPKKAKGSFKLSVTAKSKKSSASETESLKATFLAIDGANTMTTSETQTSSAAEKTATETSESKNGNDQEEDDDEDKKATPISTILLATLIPILSIAFILMLVACLIRRRRNKQTYLNSNYRRNISNPMPETLTVNGMLASDNETESIRALEKAKLKDGAGIITTASTFNPLTDVESHGSSRSGSSDGYVARGAIIPPSMRTVSENTSGESQSRRSWVTVDTVRHHHTNSKSTNSKSLTRNPSDATVPDLPQANLPLDKSFRSNLEVTIPSLSDLSILPEMVSSDALGARHSRARGHTDTLSLASSGIFPPSSTISEPFNLDIGSIVRRNLDHRPSTAPPAPDAQEKVDSVSDMKAPPAAQTWRTSTRLSSGLGRRSSTHTGSFVTESSFGSSENWKVHPSAADSFRNSIRNSTIINSHSYRGSVRNSKFTTHSIIEEYHDIVAAAPYNPSRPGTSRGPKDEQGGVRQSGEGGSGSSEWESVKGWSREGTGLTGKSGNGSKDSRGSFQVFL